MPEDVRSDESLIEAYRGGDEAALNTLFERYTKGLWLYLAKHSFFGGDDAYLDDLAQEILLVVFEEIKSGKFVSQGEGSFKGWLYTVAYLETLRADKKRRQAPEPISQLYPKEPTGLPDELLTKRPIQTKDYDVLKSRLNEVCSTLSSEEQKLMRLVSEGKSYKEIQKEPEFQKYSLDYLMLKVYNIRQKIIKRRRKI